MQLTATPPAARRAPLALPADIAAHLSRFNLTLSDLLTDSNPKLAKGADRAAAVILHHLPARALAAAVTPGNHGATAPRSYLPDLAALADREGLAALARKHNGCPWATVGCAAGCLNWAGHGGLSAAVAAARGRRTLAMIADPVAYGRAVLWAIARCWAQAQAQGLPLAVRLRGTDEGPAVGWHRLAITVTPSEVQTLRRRFGIDVLAGDGVDHTIARALSIPAQDGTMKLYDYSKSPVSGPLGLLAQQSAGWDVTASFAADRPTAIADAINAHRAGFRIAVPIALSKGTDLPKTLLLTGPDGGPLTIPAIGGDDHDHRWADPKNVVVILRTKASHGADRAIADPFSLRPTDEPQTLADGTIRLIW
jgi:hypothetical protein